MTFARRIRSPWNQVGQRPSRSALLVVLALLAWLAGVPVAAQERVIYSEGFEEGIGSYTTSVGNGAQWQWGTPTAGPGAAHSGTKVWGTGLTTSMVGTGSITSSAIALPALQPGQVARVTFWAWINVSMFDRGRFLTSSDGSTFKLNAELFMDMGGGWKPYSFDVSSYAGGNLYLQFLVQAGQPGFAGMYIDDINITVYDTSGARRLFTLEASEVANGSCPWVFPWDGTTYRQDNDIYSVARQPAGEYTDYYRLERPLVSRDGKYPLEIRELDTERSWTDWVQLLAVDHASDVQVAPDNAGAVHAWRPASLVSASASSSDGAAALAASVDDNGISLYSEERVTLTFGPGDLSAGAHLVLRARGFLDGAGADRPFIGPPAVVVEVQSADGTWHQAGRYKPRYMWGVEAYDLSPFVSGFGAISVRLSAISHGQKYHEVDFVGLALGPEPHLLTREQPLVRAEMGQIDLLERLTRADRDYVLTQPGESYRIEFEEQVQSGDVRDFIFVSRGYYIPGSGTYFIYTWDGTQWAMRDGYSFPATDGTRTFDLSLFLPDPNGEFKVRVWQDYSSGYAAAIDYVGFTLDGVAGTLSSAKDLRNQSDAGIGALVAASDNAYFPLNARNSTGGRDRWSEYAWTGFTVNRPPTASAVSFDAAGLIGWTYADTENTPQAAYQVQVWTGALGTGSIFFDPGLTQGTEQAVYVGQALTPGTTYYVRVKVSDGENWSQWAEASFTAPAMTTHLLTVTADGAGAGTVVSTPLGLSCGATCAVSFVENASVVLVATPAVGSSFVGWSGEGCAGTDPCTVNMTAARSVTATFSDTAPATMPLSLTKVGVGAVTSSPAGVDCGSTCSADFTTGASVTLTAASVNGSTFTGWSGAGCSGTGTCTVSMTQARSVIATFTGGTPATYSLTVTKSGAGSGTVTSSPAGISCGATCSATFTTGTVVTLSATAATGYAFAGWSGESCSGTGTCQVTMSAARSVTANFYDPRTATMLAAEPDPVTYGSSVTMTATVTPSNATGTISFYDGAVLLNTVAISGGQASWTTSALTAGVHSLTAAYNGDATHDSSVSTADTITVRYPAPTVTGVVKVGQPTGAGTTIRISGTQFRAGAVVAVGTLVASNVTVVSATAIEAFVPGHAGNPADVLVTNDDGQSGSLTAAFDDGRAYYFAEGATGAFDMKVSVFNPNAVATPVIMRFYTAGGDVVTHDLGNLPAMTRRVVDVSSIAGLAAASMFTHVISTSGLPLAVERTMAWDSGHGAHAMTALEQLSSTWAFAEGSASGFDTYFLFGNPGNVEAIATVRFTTEAGSVIEQEVRIGARSRATLRAADVPALRGQAFAAYVTSTEPVVAERAVYLGETYPWEGGHASGGTPALSTVWHFAEGAVGTYFDYFLLVGNPNDADATLSLTIRFSDGTGETRVVTAPGGRRLTLPLLFSGTTVAKSMAFSLEVTSNQPVVAERAMYWRSNGHWLHETGQMGTTRPAVRWGFADMGLGGAAAKATYLLVANPGAEAAIVEVTHVLDGSQPTMTMSIPAGRRVTLDLGVQSALANQGFATLVTATNGVPVVAERATYWNARGTAWAAGTNVFGTPLWQGVAPLSGTIAGGTTVTIAGGGFSAGATVAFGGVPATDVQVLSDTIVTAVTPAHADGTVAVVVTNPGATAGSQLGTFTYVAIPTVTGVEAASLPSALGTSLRIAGTGFREGLTVTAGGVALTAVTVVSDTEVTGLLRGHVGQDATVVVTNPTGRSGQLVAALDDPMVYYFAEGATGVFSHEIALANGNEAPAPVTLTFFRGDGSQVTQNVTVPAGRMQIVSVNEIPGLGSGAMGASVSSTTGLPLGVSRTMTWAHGHGMHQVDASDRLSYTWAFAEGSVNGFDTYLLVLNPGATDATVDFRFLDESGAEVTTRLLVAAHSRNTLRVGDLPALAGKSFATFATASVPVAIERAMYLGTYPWEGGHAAFGDPNPGTVHQFAEGSTGTFFDSFLLLGNAGGLAATVNVRVVFRDGTSEDRAVHVPAGARVTLPLTFTADRLDASREYSLEVTSDQAVAVERAMYWRKTEGGWLHGKVHGGEPSPDREWDIVDVRQGGPSGAQTYVLLFNPAFVGADVTIQFTTENGDALTRTYQVPAATRKTIDLGQVSGLSGTRFTARVLSSMPILLEAVTYWSIGGTTWAAGSDAAVVRRQTY